MLSVRAASFLVAGAFRCSGCLRQAALPTSRRSFLTVNAVRSWFLDGPEAMPDPTAASALPPLPPPPPPSLPPAEASLSSPTSFFVQDAPPPELLDATAQALIEPTFASLGLGTGLWPTSIFLKLLETLHIGADMPWWLCAVAIGVGVRIVMLYPNMLMQRSMRLEIPQMTALAMIGDMMKFAKHTSNYGLMQDLVNQAIKASPDFADQTKIRKLRNRLLGTYALQFGTLTFVQLAGIRAVYRATALPVESFQQGGLLWITDLTCIDPYCIMPAAITALFMLNVRFYYKNSVELPKPAELAKPLVYSLLPAFIFTMMLNFPGANLFYFLATGCTAQMLHRLNSTEAGKAFWKRHIGLPLASETQSMTSISKAVQQIKKEVQPLINSRDYQATRLPTRPSDTEIPKTYRIRQQRSLE